MRRLTASLLIGALAASLAPAGPARAADLRAVVSANPVDHTPHVLDGTVWAVATVGDLVVVGGDFTTVTDHTGAHRHARRHLFAYRLSTGEVTPWAPAVDRAVYALAAGADQSVYVGGWFTRVNGTAQRGLARLSLRDGQRYPGFSTNLNWGDVRAIAVSGTMLYAGGTFSAVNGVARTALARMDARTGAVDTRFDPAIAAPGLPRARIEDFALSPDGRHLVVIGAFRYLGRQPRHSIAVLYTWGPTAAVTGWYTSAFSAPCLAGFDTYTRGVDFAPTGDWFVVVTTGRTSHRTKLCDTASRFDLAGTGDRRPVWVNHTGGDSLYSVAVTTPAVYVGGHQRWANNRYGLENAGPGAVPRSGIAALHPATGAALAWNPGKSRGVGTRALVPTSAGLVVGSDTERLGGERHARLGMFPLP